MLVHSCLVEILKSRDIHLVAEKDLLNLEVGDGLLENRVGLAAFGSCGSRESHKAGLATLRCPGYSHGRSHLGACPSPRATDFLGEKDQRSGYGQVEILRRSALCLCLAGGSIVSDLRSAVMFVWGMPAAATSSAARIVCLCSAVIAGGRAAACSDVACLCSAANSVVSGLRVEVMSV